MWIITTVGFFSVVQKPGQNGLTIRARVSADLDQLRQRYMPELSPTLHGGGTDYPFRSTISHADFGRGLARMGNDIHYGNFKSAVGKAMGQRREAVYHKVWHLLAGLEDEKR